MLLTVATPFVYITKYHEMAKEMCKSFPKLSNFSASGSRIWCALGCMFRVFVFLCVKWCVTSRTRKHTQPNTWVLESTVSVWWDVSIRSWAHRTSTATKSQNSLFSSGHFNFLVAEYGASEKGYIYIYIYIFFWWCETICTAESRLWAHSIRTTHKSRDYVFKGHLGVLPDGYG